MCFHLNFLVLYFVKIMNHRTYFNPKMLHLPLQPFVNNAAAIHVNPNYRKNGNIFVNPLFVQNQTNSQPTTSQNIKPVAPKAVSHNVQSISSRYTWRKKPDAGKLNHDTIKATTTIVTKCGKKLIRRPVQTPPKSKVTKQTVKTKFKLDKRPLDVQNRSITKRQKFSIHKLVNLFPKNVYSLNKRAPLKKRPVENAKKQSANKKLINIGGILYRATSNKLTRAPAAASSSNPKKCNKSTNKLVLNVRGESFMLSGNGATLKRLPSDNRVGHQRQRVDFGGVTYRQTTGDTFVRTNAHHVRSVLTQARQKSIACLASRRRKINTPCQIFRKLGRCSRNQSGICVYTHDKKNIDLCKEFLQGKCINKECLLSHNAGHQKVPTCKFFLDGACGRDNCPYLHVKVSEAADVCVQFLQGYCAKGNQCSKRHVNICPEFEKIGLCKKGKKCPYPHGKVKKSNLKTKRKTKQVAVAKKKAKTKEIEKAGDGVRYYDAESDTSGKEVVLPKRQRLDSLPSFIAF